MHFGKQPKATAMTCPSRGVDMLEAALGCVASGWSIFPCRNKRPLIAGGFKNASCDPVQIGRWWRQWRDAQIGAALPDTLMVVDVDGDAGRQSMMELQRQHVPLPPTLTCHTGSGGLHYYFRPPFGELRQTTGVLGDHIDTRMAGKGYVILPPSLHDSGKRYQWVDATVPAAWLPGWMAQRLRPLPPPVRQSLTTTHSTTQYAQAALDGETSNVATAIKGQRNTALHVAAVKLGTLVGADVVSEDDVRTALTAAAQVNGYTDDKGPKATESTIQSGLMWGIAHPRTMA